MLCYRQRDITVNKHLNKAINICQVKPRFILQYWEENWCVVIQWQLPWFLCIRPECGHLQRFPTTQIFKPSGCCSRIYLSLYDTPGYVLFESAKFIDLAHQTLILWFLLWPYSIYASLLSIWTVLPTHTLS